MIQLEEVAKKLTDTANGAEQVTTLAKEISSGSQEQSRGITQINTGILEIDKDTQELASNSQRVASASEATLLRLDILRENIMELSQLGEGGTAGAKKSALPEPMKERKT